MNVQIVFFLVVLILPLKCISTSTSLFSICVLDSDVFCNSSLKMTSQKSLIRHLTVSKLQFRKVSA